MVGRAPLRPLLGKELREVLSGRAVWTMLLILCPLVGYSFFQAVALYSEASVAARGQPMLASGLSPLDGILVPTFGAFYVSVTLLFPFVAIRALGREKETGALKLLVQLPYRIPTLIAAKLAAITTAWLICLIPIASALVLWLSFGGHLNALETGNLLCGHLRQFRNCCHRDPCFYDWFLGAGLRVGGPAGHLGLDISPFIDADASQLRARAFVGCTFAGCDHRDRGLRHVDRHMAPSGQIAAR